MSRQLTYRIVISSRPNSILVERQLEMGREWKTIDRYNTHDLTAELKRTDPWIAEVLALCSQPSAAIQIAIPKVPLLQPTVAERLERYEREARELEMQAQHDAEFKSDQFIDYNPASTFHNISRGLSREEETLRNEL